MISVPMRTSGPLTRQTVLSLNQRSVQGARDFHSIQSAPDGSRPASPVAPVEKKPVPSLQHPIRKGQKAALEPSKTLNKVEAQLSWNVKRDDCDVDVSAFLLDESGKVPGDDWFVFYGQETSPDQSTVFSAGSGMERERITIDFTRLAPGVSKIVFVLTINEAFEKNLNFSMLEDACIRIMDGADHTELVSFQMDEYYANATSMMIGELYRYHGAWKFNAIGNGVERDLAGLCEYYGVQVE